MEDRAMTARKTELVGTRLPPDLLERVNAFADSEFLNRSEAVRELVTRGLAFGRKVLSRAETEKLLHDIKQQAFNP
jgi:metal-responsive CopG/Arc/MetJ family transcriptional regulator